MKIKLKAPFSKDYDKGYLVTNSKNRKFVILYNSANDRTTIPYARYLMSVKLKRYLKDDEHVDHIDNDKTNDDINNLQILSQTENNQKEGRRRVEEKK